MTNFLVLLYRHCILAYLPQLPVALVDQYLLTIGAVKSSLVLGPAQMEGSSFSYYDTSSIPCYSLRVSIESHNTATEVTWLPLGKGRKRQANIS